MSENVSHTRFEAPSLEEVISLFPTYDVHRLIACGGMGAVYHATQRSLERDVAIKILPREFAQDAEFVASFEAEAKAMAKLNHPNLIGIYDSGDTSGMLYIVMELVVGTSLYAACHGHAVEQAEAVRIVAAVCRGLAHAHQYGILHRDIKPSNILIDANTNPKVGDFGLARSLDKRIEEGEQIFGTPGYTAPEVISPPHAFDQRADIFSVGVMLYELLTGITPNGEVPVASLPPVPHPRLRAVIHKATHPDPSQRYNSADELADELEKIAVLANNPLLVASPRKTAKPFVQHKKTFHQKSSGGGFIWFLLVVLLIAGVYYFISRNQSEGDATPVPPTIGSARPSSSNDSAQPPVRRKTAAEEGIRPNADVDAFFIRLEGMVRDRMAVDIQTYRSAMNQEADAFFSSASQIISRTAASQSAVMSAELQSVRESCARQNNLLPDALPGSLGNQPELQQLFSDAQLKQLKERNRYQFKLRSEQAQYIRSLEKQIREYQREQDHIAAGMLQTEISRIHSEPGYFEFLMTR